MSPSSLSPALRTSQSDSKLASMHSPSLASDGAVDKGLVKFALDDAREDSGLPASLPPSSEETGETTDESQVSKRVTKIPELPACCG